MLKPLNLSKIVGVGVLSLSMTILPLGLSVSAQESPSPGSTGEGTQMTETPGAQMTETPESGDRDFDWGWLGLIGLAGLAGLARKREEPTRYRDPNATGTTGYRE